MDTRHISLWLTSHVQGGNTVKRETFNESFWFLSVAVGDLQRGR